MQPPGTGLSCASARPWCLASECRPGWEGCPVVRRDLPPDAGAWQVIATAHCPMRPVRFRWTCGTAAVAGMAHDVVVLVGVFAWLGKTFDGVFLAALLTVIGYSINDSVVIFDRVREARGLRPTQRLPQLANEALVQTLPRTVNTGLGALFILVALYLLGGDTLADFALALIVGTTVGMYSSLVVATPVFLWLERLRVPADLPVRHAPAATPGRGAGPSCETPSWAHRTAPVWPAGSLGRERPS